MSFLVRFSIAQAPSPAYYLLDEALTTLEERYFGFAHIDYQALNLDATQRLELACKDLAPCPFPVAEPILDDLLARVGDGHTFRLTPIAWAQFVANSDNAPLPMIGLKFAPLPDASALVVTRVLEGSPAKLAGIVRGDAVWALNGVPLDTFKSATEAVNAITTLEMNQQSISLELSHGIGEHKILKLEAAGLKPWLPSYELRVMVWR